MLTFERRLACLALLLLGGCAESQLARQGLQPFLAPPPAPLEVLHSEQGLFLRASPTGELDGAEQEKLAALLHALAPLERQAIVLTPYTEAGESAARRLRERFTGAGYPAPEVRPRAVQAEAGDRSPAAARADLALRASVLRTSAPGCAIRDARLWTERPYDAVGPLGCAVRANLGAMVAEPGDLLRPRPLAGAEGQQAAAAVDRYRQDKVKEPAAASFSPGASSSSSSASTSASTAGGSN